MFNGLVGILKDIEVNGIEIALPSGNKVRVFSCYVRFWADNLGLNPFLGFTKSFSSMFYCRLCSVSNDDALKLCVEMLHVLRTHKFTKDKLKVAKIQL